MSSEDPRGCGSDRRDSLDGGRRCTGGCAHLRRHNGRRLLVAVVGGGPQDLDARTALTGGRRRPPAARRRLGPRPPGSSRRARARGAPPLPPGRPTVLGSPGEGRGEAAMRAARPERPPDAASWSSPRRSGAAGSAATVVGVTPPWGAFAVAVYPVGWPSHARRTAAALVATERSSILRTAGLHRPGPCAVVADRSVQPDGLLRIASLGLTAPVEEGATDTVCPGAPTHRATSPPLGHRRAMKGTAPCTTLTDPTMGTRPPRREPQPGRAPPGPGCAGRRDITCGCWPWRWVPSPARWAARCSGAWVRARR